MGPLPRTIDFVEHAEMVDSKGEERIPGDDDLMRRFIAGDEAAFRGLMDRYDRLVRYTVFRRAKVQCTRDEGWLDAVASDVWTSFARLLSSDPFRRPQNAAAFLHTMASRRTISALRERSGTYPSAKTTGQSAEFDKIEDSGLEDPSDAVSRLEQLESLRACLSDATVDDRRMLDVLGLIMERKWEEAGTALGWPESTLRSRWSVLLQKLGESMGRKRGESFAPKGGSFDIIK